MNVSRKKRLLALLCLLLLSAAGCRGTAEEPAQPLPRLVIGSDAFSPYFYLDEDGNYAGVDAELAREACRRLGYEPEFRLLVWDRKDEALADGTVDCLWGSFSMNGREEDYTWAGPYLQSRQMVAVQAESEAQTLADLAGLRVAVQATGKAEELLCAEDRTGLPAAGAVYCFSTMDEVWAALRGGYADAAAGHESALRSRLSADPDRYRLLAEPLLLSDLGVAFEKGTHTELARALTEVLAEMQADGTIRAAAQAYGLDGEGVQ